MGATEDLLRSMPDEVGEDRTAYLTIDPDTRVITVPSNEKIFGVETDKDSERKYFRCPRIVGDNIDLSQHKIYISYVSTTSNALKIFPKADGSYWCDDVAVDGDYITFSWKLSRNVFKEPGFVAFKVLAKKTDGDIEKTRWNTAPAFGTVLLTVPDGESVEERYPDIVTQLLERMDAVEAIATEEAMQGYVNEYLGEHPVQLDKTLTDNTKAAPAGVVGELKGDLAYIADIGETITVTSPQLADIKSIKVGRISNTYHQTRYDSEPNTDSNYKTLDAIEFDDESKKSLRMNFKPSNISCYRASDGTYEGVTPVSNVIDNGDGSFSVTINANIKPKYVRISWGTTSYPNLVPLITLESEWDADADPTFIGSKTIITETTLKEKVVDVRNFSDEAKEYIHPTISNPCKYNGDEICMFGKGLCIGDSLTYGQSDRNDGGSLGGFKHIGMTYPDNLTRLTGIELTNAGTAGKTFKTWWELHQNDDFSGYDFCIIALGVNDAYFNGGWTADSLTYLTNIVNAVRNANNHIPIFITTPPKYFLGYTGADFESVATGIRNASSTLGLYLIDFREYLEEFSRDNALKISVLPYGHFNAYGYFKIAKAYKAYISYIMSNNMDDFRNVQFVGTDYSYTTN